MFPPQQNPSPQGDGGNQHDMVAIACGVGAAFLWADPAYDLTIGAFRHIAVRNYGYDALEVFEWAYWIFLHVAVFAITRVATNLAITAIITALGYRLALSF